MGRGLKQRRAQVADASRREDQGRQATRFSVDFEVDYRAEDTFLFAYISNLSKFGIFVRTDTPEEVGTHLLLRFQPTGFDYPLELQGRVIWINPVRERAEENRNPGMGVQFTDLSESQRGALLGLVKKLAYLEDDDLYDQQLS